MKVSEIKPEFIGSDETCPFCDEDFGSEEEPEYVNVIYKNGENEWVFGYYHKKCFVEHEIMWNTILGKP